MEEGGLGEGRRRKEGWGRGGERPELPAPLRPPRPRPSPVPVPSSPEWPHRAQQEGPRQRGPGQPRAGGERSKKRFISETKAYFFRQDCLCSYLMAAPWLGSRRPQTRSAVSLRPAVLIWSGTSKRAFHKRIKTARPQHRDRTGNELRVGGGGRPLRAISKHFSKESLQLVRLDEIFCPKLIIIMNLHFFPQENN